jgi:hypothetical protein
MSIDKTVPRQNFASKGGIPKRNTKTQVLTGLEILNQDFKIQVFKKE